LEKKLIYPNRGTDVSDLRVKDRVYLAALDLATESVQGIDGFAIDDVLERADLDPSSRRTVRRVLAALQESGYLRKEKPRGHTWFPGERLIALADENTNASADASAGAGPGAGAHGYNTRARPGASPDASAGVEPGADADTDPRVSTGTGADTGADPGASDSDQESDGRDELPSLDEIDVAGSGDLERDRRELVVDVVRLIRDDGPISPAEIRDQLFDDEPIGYKSKRSAWKNCVYPALSALDVVETGGEGSHSWFWTGD
jgi:hypothetical protein